MGDIFSMNPRQGNLAPLIEATMMGSAAQMQPQQGGFIGGFSQAFKPQPLDQMQMAKLRTLGGLISPIGGGLY